MSKKILAIVLAVLMTLSNLPAVAQAAEQEHHHHCPGESYEHTVENCLDYTTVKIVPATCGKEGYDLRQCNVCGHRFAVNVIPATGDHHYEDVEALQPGCEQDGHTAGKKCSVCGDLQGCQMISALDHDWVSTNHVDCTVGGTLYQICSRCEKERQIDLVPGSHQWEYELLKPIAGETGLARRCCIRCGISEQFAVYPNHDCVFVPVAEVAATCTQSGVKAHEKCLLCGRLTLDGEEVTLQQLHIDALGHIFGHALSCDETDAVCIRCHQRVATTEYEKIHDFVVSVTVAPTCTTAGVRTYVCACGESKTEPIEPLNHSWKDGLEPSCTYADALCETCGYQPGKLPCSYGEWIVEEEAGCTSEGWKIKVCKNCHEEIGEKIPAKGHEEFVVHVAANCSNYGYHYMICLREDCPVETVDGEHRLSDVTVEYEAGYDKDNHNFTLTTDIPADCTHDGLKSWCCSYCNVQGPQQIIPAGHTVVIDEYVEPTCTSSGKTEGSHCSVCNAVLVEQKPIAPVDHDWDEGKVTLKSSCISMGVKTFTCADCGGTKTERIPMTSHNLVAGLVIKTPTCKTTGWQIYSCTECPYMTGEKLEIVDHKWVDVDTDHSQASHMEHIPYVDQKCQWCDATNRVWGDHWEYCHANDFEAFDGYEQAQLLHEGGLNAENEGVLYRVGTCEKKGMMQYECSKCRMYVYVYVQEDDCGATGSHVYRTEATEGPLAGQIITPDNAHKDPTCFTVGYQYTYHCARCGEGCGDGSDGSYLQLEKTQHDLHLNPDYVESNCADPIYENAPKYYCVNEGCNHVEYDGTVLIASKKDGILCKEYNFEFYLCSCGEKHLRNLVGDFGCYWVNMDLQMDEMYIAATCTTEGRHSQYCFFCGEIRVVTDPCLPHENAEGAYFTGACTDPEEDHFCIHCNKNIEDIHNWVVNNWFDATCLEDGYWMCICADCGLTEVRWDHSVPAKGHQIPSDGFKEEVKSTFDAAGYAIYDCAICGMEQRIEYARLSGITVSVPEEEYTFGSLVEITVNMENARGSLWGYTFDFVFDASMIRFIGYENRNSGFNMEVTEEKVANEKYYLTALATAVNSDDGKRQDVDVEKSAPLVTLYFRVVAQLEDRCASDVAWLGLYNFAAINAKGEDVTPGQLFGEQEITIRRQMDFNADGFVTLDDLWQAVGMLSGEHSQGKLYDVTMDLDGDGQITLEDIRIAYCIFVEDFSSVDVLLSRVSDEEAEILGYEKIYCSHADCDYVSDTVFHYCPQCGTKREL